MPALTTELLLMAYANGVFPMAAPEEGNAIGWYAPDPRAILPLDAFHCPQSLGRVVRQGRFEVVTDRDFAGVMRACASGARQDGQTWISPEIIAAYCQLHAEGYAHSVECWQHGQLAGGLYGVSLGGAFFGESMFTHVRDASKVALVHLVTYLRAHGFVLLDVQLQTRHLARFGVIEIPRRQYERRLAAAVRRPACWPPGPSQVLAAARGKFGE